MCVCVWDSGALLHSIVLQFGVIVWKQSCQTAFSKSTLGGGPFKASIIITSIIIISSSSSTIVYYYYHYCFYYYYYLYYYYLYYYHYPQYAAVMVVLTAASCVHPGALRSPVFSMLYYY